MSDKNTKTEPFPTPTEEIKNKAEHIVYVDSIGGATVLSCESLSFKNLDMIYDKLTEETVKDTIIHFRPHLGEIKNLEIKVIDNRE